jgi:hypothetical protein
MTALVFWLALIIPNFLQADEWRRIIPLRSTREDVERILGPATGNCQCIFESVGANVQVQFSKGTCGEGESAGWTVRPGTVISFTVYFKKRPPLSELKIDWKNYKKTEDPELPDIFYFVNKEEGIIISVDDNRVMEYQIVPTEKDGGMRCPEPTVKPNRKPL